MKFSGNVRDFLWNGFMDINLASYWTIRFITIEKWRDLDFSDITCLFVCLSVSFFACLLVLCLFVCLLVSLIA